MIVMIDLMKSQLTGQGHHQVGWSSRLSSSSSSSSRLTVIIISHHHHHQVGWSSPLSSSSSSSGRLTDACVARGNPQVGWATTGDSLCLLIIKIMIVFFTAEYVEIKLQDNATYTQPLDQTNDQNSLQNWVDPPAINYHRHISKEWDGNAVKSIEDLMMTMKTKPSRARGADLVQGKNRAKFSSVNTRVGLCTKISWWWSWLERWVT